MTDKEFEILQKEIDEAEAYLERLQKQYVRLTGKRYVPNKLKEAS